MKTFMLVTSFANISIAILVYSLLVASRGETVLGLLDFAICCYSLAYVRWGGRGWGK